MRLLQTLCANVVLPKVPDALLEVTERGVRLHAQRRGQDLEVAQALARSLRVRHALWHSQDVAVRRRVGPRNGAGRVVGAVALPLAAIEHGEAQADLGDGDEDADDDEDDDDPGDRAHLGIVDRVGQNLGEVEEDAAALIEDLDAWVDFEVFADGDVEGVQGRLRVPEEVRHVQDI
jgi:hypothetical protein